MDDLFDPDSIAVIGASSDLDRVSGLPIKYLQKHGYDGDIIPINPKHDEIAGLPSYANITDLPEPPDLVMIILPARYVLETTRECLEYGVENVLIVSSGFSESGNEAEEAELSQLATNHDANIIGPNSQGLLNIPEHVTASFTPALMRDELRAGGISFVSQSGAFGGALTTILQDNMVGLRKMVATGNEADLESLDFLAHFAADDDTTAVAAYLEGVKDGRKLIELKRTQAGIDLPIVAFKVGSSDRGHVAAASHTGKIASSHRIYEGVFKETGVMLVEDVDIFVDVLRTLTILDHFPGPRIGVLTTSGGAGVHIADVVAAEGLELPDLDETTTSRMEEILPDYGSALNPIDLTAQVVNSQDALRECLNVIFENDIIDTLVLQITNTSGEDATERAKLVRDVAANHETPMFVSWTGGIEKSRGRQIYEGASIPVFENPARCIRTIAHLARFCDSKPALEAARTTPSRLSEIDTLTEPPDPVVTETAGKELLAEYGINVPAERLLSSPAGLQPALEDIGFPLVAKLVASDLQHRNRIGGVITGIDSVSEARDACMDLFKLADEHNLDLKGVSLQEQIPGGLECSIGCKVDPDFGPVLMFGRGGVDIEDLNDVTFRTIPVGRKQASRMIDDLETFDVGTLSKTEYDHLIDVITAFSDLYVDNQWIDEGDVNPLIVGDDRVVAVDALFIAE